MAGSTLRSDRQSTQSENLFINILTGLTGSTGLCILFISFQMKEIKLSTTFGGKIQPDTVSYDEIKIFWNLFAIFAASESTFTGFHLESQKLKNPVNHVDPV